MNLRHQYLLRLILPLLLLTLLAACQRGDPAIDALHITADSLMQSRPDSALHLLQACDTAAAPPIGTWPHQQRMRHELLRAKAMNKAYVNLTTDSVMKEVADYYDSHGTPNERMEAHYLLGCTYRDLGEAPRAIDSYLDAVNCADTTAADCDYWLMASVYGQMADLYYQQLLLTYEIEAHQKACRYDLMASDTLWALHEQKMIACTYILQNKRDSAELMLNDVISRYKERGYEQEALLTSTMLMHIYMASPEKAGKLKALIEEYDSKSDDFDENHELHSSKRLFYRYKGKLCENTGQLDSAEYYYRKMYYRDMLLTEQNSMYEGLLNVFVKRRNEDSIAKYAQLYCAVNDSSIALKDQEITAQIAASYNYNRYQKLAFQNEMRAYKLRTSLVVIVLFVAAVSILLFIRWQRFKAKRKMEQQELEKLKAEFSDVMERYSKNKKAMQLLEKAHQDVVNSAQEQLQTIEEINKKYEESIALFRTENERLKAKIGELSSQQSISKLLEKNMRFAEEPIVKRLLELADNPRLHICKKEWDEFIHTVGDYYPDMLKDLKRTPEITNQELYTTLLVILNMRTDDIARLIDVSGQRVTNIKSSLNFTLFGVKSARPLHENLTKRYSIHLFE